MLTKERERASAGASGQAAVLADGVVVSYWNERAASYSAGVCDELSGLPQHRWKSYLREHLNVGESEQTLRAGDFGCGPGFFSILLAQMGCKVDAVDMSAEMLGTARANVRRAGVADQVSFHQGDVMSTPFAEETFDVIALRNVTWLMRDPEAAYREWHRLLKPGGKLLVFDANWYRYLVDPVVAAQRILDQSDGEVLGWNEESLATQAQETRCEAMAACLPLTNEIRPQWDRRVLDAIGFSSIEVDADAWRRLWSEGEQVYYGSSPLFFIKAVK